MKKNTILIILIIIILALDIYLFSTYIYAKYRNKIALETTDIKIANEISNSPFGINKIILYSSASAKNKNTNFQNINWILDIFQYTDIAIYIEANTPIKNLSISNPKFSKNSQALYYLDANEFGTGQSSQNFEISNNLDFSILNFDNSDNSIAYNTPVFFADCSNPITLKFTNLLFENYLIKNTEKLTFNGSLLSKTPINLEQLHSKISFNINITNYNNKTYSTTLNLTIPVETKSSTIFDGYIYLEKELNLPLF